MNAAPIDALFVVSFGGPEHPDDVMPFLENVTAGRGVPRERLVEVAAHYQAFGGMSPINQQNRDLIDAIRRDFAAHDLDIPVYWGNRNWDPYLRDAIAQMEADGVRHAAYFVTSAYASYSGCRQYRENLFEASDGSTVGLSRLRHYFNHPGFVTPFIEGTAEALEASPGAHVVFVTHSIPIAMNDVSGGPGQEAYRRQHEEVARLVAEATGAESSSLAYCSRSGPPHQPWLEPDINDHLRELASAGTRSVVVVPIGFVSDHMEVVFDLDTEAAQTAAELGLQFQRVATPGVHPAFVAMVRELMLEPPPQPCAPNCCENPRQQLPTVP